MPRRQWNPIGRRSIEKIGDVGLQVTAQDGDPVGFHASEQQALDALEDGLYFAAAIRRFDKGERSIVGNRLWMRVKEHRREVRQRFGSSVGLLVGQRLFRPYPGLQKNLARLGIA